MESDKLPLPKADTIFDTLGAGSYFSTMDINQAFQQPIRPEDKGLHSLCDAQRLYQYTRLPMGMRNSSNAVWIDYFPACCIKARLYM